MPPPSGLPMVRRSGSSPHSRVAPPGPAQMAWVSSMINNEPYFLVSVRSASWYPGSGRTMPMFVSRLEQNRSDVSVREFAFQMRHVIEVHHARRHRRIDRRP